MEYAFPTHEIGTSSPFWPHQIDVLSGCPQRLYVAGDPQILSEPSLSIIGARRATPYGLAVAEMAGRIAAECGIVVVSGGALGCDYTALRAALDAGGRVIIVAGTGADVIYPNSSRDIFEQARTGGGAVVSLEKWQTEPRPYFFPKRNRIIAALSAALIVCEASMPSGTFSTANTSLDLDRILYAVPGSIFSPSSRGTNYLLEQGAQIITDEKGLEMRISLDFNKLRLISSQDLPDRGRLLSALIASPLRVQELSEHIGESVLNTLRSLADHESLGLVVRLPDGRFSPTEEALISYKMAQRLRIDEDLQQKAE